MRRVIFNQKGGVGKSTITCNLAAISAHFGKKTLVIDLDAQSNSSQYLLGDRYESSTPGIADYYEKVLALTHQAADASHYVHPTPFDNLSIIPASNHLAALEFKLFERQKIYKLRALLDALPEFEAIFIDTPPAFNFYTQSALIAAERCLIPFDCDLFARKAIDRLIEGVKSIQSEYHEALSIEGIIVNQFQPQAKLPLRLIQELKSQNLNVLMPFLTSSIQIRESHEVAKPMVAMNATHKITREYIELYESMLGINTVNNTEMPAPKPKKRTRKKQPETA